MSQPKTNILLKSTLVILAGVIALLLFAPMRIGIGNRSSTHDTFFGVFHWLIVTRETVLDPATRDIVRYHHTVINPQGTALTLAAAVFCLATIVWCWRRIGHGPLRFTR